MSKFSIYSCNTKLFHLFYFQMGEVNYPIKIRTTTIEEDILNEAIYFMNFLSRQDNFDDDEPSESRPHDSRYKCIKLEDLKLFSQRHTDVTADYLEKLRYTYSKHFICNNPVVIISPNL